MRCNPNPFWQPSCFCKCVTASIDSPMEPSIHERLVKPSTDAFSVAEACIAGDSSLAEPANLTSEAFSSSDDERRRLLHALANVITGLLMNAQAVDWKLPPYSRLKRPIREIARAAERAAELTRGLQHGFESARDTTPVNRPEQERERNSPIRTPHIVDNTGRGDSPGAGRRIGSRPTARERPACGSWFFLRFPRNSHNAL